MIFKKVHNISFILTNLLLCGMCMKAQSQVNGKNLLPIQEKIFAHTDKDFYVAGEILWFKLYDVSADSLKPLNLSNLAYVEILNAQQKPVLQATVALNNGSGNGSFYLTSSITSGNYIFRAYTNWMKNFGASSYFQKAITVINTLTPLSKPANKDSANYEIGFFPEGGNLVAQITSKVAFKVTDKYGKGVQCSGNIVDENNRDIVSFTSLKFGMGSFYFTPQQGHTYAAVINIDGKKFTKPLPGIYDKGYVIQVNNTGQEQLNVSVYTNINLQQPVYLVAYAGNSVKKALMQTTDAAGKTIFSLKKNDLPAGITHLVIFNNSRQPVCERLIFSKPQTLHLTLATDKNVYATRSEVKMNIGSNDKSDLSMAVYLLDSLQAPGDENILNYFWLTSELKGRIESPQFYFENNNGEADSALDNLLLTQGWSRFKWEEAARSNQPLFRFAPEHEGHLIEGTVIDKNSGLPGANVRVYLSVPGTHYIFTSSVSNDSGHVVFDVKDFYGSGELVVQTAKADSMYRVEIEDPFSIEASDWNVEPLNLNESQVQQLSRHSLTMQVRNAYTLNQLNRFISPAIDSNAFYGVPDNKYFLDDYTRFNTMEEVLREYVTGIDVRIRQGNYSLVSLDNIHHGFFNNGPLVLIDGVPVFDMNKLMAYNPLKIKKAEVVLRKYYLNSLVAEGILSYSTYKGDLDGFRFDPGTIELSYDGLQLQREFYSPQYASEEAKQSRLPDYRNVLYWSPQIITQRDAQISFYTSDVKGRYIAIVQGIGANGKAGYTSAGFEVK